MVAKHGEIQSWYFAHHSGTDCQSGYESAIHLAVKRVIEANRRLLLPSCNVLQHPPGVLQQPRSRHPFKAKTRLFGTIEYLPWSAKGDANSFLRSGLAELPRRLIRFDAILVEQQEGNIRPDLIGVVAGKRLYIEVAVTHFVDKLKEARIRERGVPTIEIEVPYAEEGWTITKLEELVLENTNCKHWIFNPKAEREAEKSQVVRVQQEQERQQKLLRELDQARRAKEARRQIYEQKYRPTHLVKFGSSPLSRIIVRLSPSHVSAKVGQHHDAILTALVGTVAQRFAGTYNQKQSQWEFPRNKETFFMIVGAISRASELPIHFIEGPNDEEVNHMLERFGFAQQK